MQILKSFYAMHFRDPFVSLNKLSETLNPDYYRIMIILFPPAGLLSQFKRFIAALLGKPSQTLPHCTGVQNMENGIFGQYPNERCRYLRMASLNNNTGRQTGYSREFSPSEKC